MDEDSWQDFVDELLDKVNEAAEDEADLLRGLSCLVDEASARRSHVLEIVDLDSDPEFGED